MAALRGMHLMCVLMMAAGMGQSAETRRAAGIATTAPGLRPPTTAAAPPPAMAAPFSPPAAFAVSGLRSDLGATVEEWKVVEPLLVKVAKALRALEPAYIAPPPVPRGPFSPADWANGSFTGPGETSRGVPPRAGFGAPPTSAPAPEVQTSAATTAPAMPDDAPVHPLSEGITVHQALADLHAALQKPGVDDATLKRQVLVVREARERAREALEDARAELLPLLTARQEATLAAMGYLEE